MSAIFRAIGVLLFVGISMPFALMFSCANNILRYHFIRVLFCY